MWSPLLAALTETIECRIQSEGTTGQYKHVFEGVLVFAAVLIYVLFNLRDPSQSQLPTWWGRCILYLNVYLYLLLYFCMSWDPVWQQFQPGGVRWAGEGRWAALHILQGWARVVPRINNHEDVPLSKTLLLKLIASKTIDSGWWLVIWWLSPQAEELQSSQEFQGLWRAGSFSSPASSPHLSKLPESENI